MANGQDSEVIVTVKEKIALFVFGVVTWHLLATLHHVEIPLLARRLQWHWSYTFYLGGRYFLIFAQIAGQWYPEPVAAALPSICGSIAGLCATGNLLVRSMTMWRRTNMFVVYTLVLLELGHWVVMIVVIDVPVVRTLYYNIRLNEPAPVGPHTLVAYYFYSFVFDIIILIITVVGLVHPQVQGLAHSSPLWNRLRKHGILYFVVIVGVNLPFVVLAWMHFNQDLQELCACLSFSISVIVSSYAVTSLLALKPKTESDSAPGQSSDPTEGSESNPLTTNIHLSLAHVASELPSESKTARTETV